MGAAGGRPGNEVTTSFLHGALDCGVFLKERRHCFYHSAVKMFTPESLEGATEETKEALINRQRGGKRHFDGGCS